MKPRMILIAFVSILLAVICTATISYSEVCFNTEIMRIGKVSKASPSSGNRIEVKGGTCNLPLTPLFLHEDLGNEGLATVLTAFSLGKTITFRVTHPDTVSWNDLVIGVHVDK